jgi:hypothetical protein
MTAALVGATAKLPLEVKPWRETKPAGPNFTCVFQAAGLTPAGFLCLKKRASGLFGFSTTSTHENGQTVGNDLAAPLYATAMAGPYVPPRIAIERRLPLALLFGENLAAAPFGPSFSLRSCFSEVDWPVAERRQGEFVARLRPLHCKVHLG